MAEVALRRVSKSYGTFKAVDDVSLKVADGEFVTLLGASGSGKTTCLRMVAGFVQPDAGQVLLGGGEATALPPHRRNTAMVFQHYALFPHLTVAENVAYGLKIRRLPRNEIEQRTLEVLRLVHLEALGKRYPAQLSGGQKQRVALARAVAIRPSVLLLDEPLSALDLKLRAELQAEIRRIQQALRTTTIFVTHDQGEALSMSDRVAVMRNGRILQIDTPVNLYQRPTSAYVASFIGTTNFLEAVVRGRMANGAGDGGRYQVAFASDLSHFFEVTADAAMAEFAEGEKCLLCLRPENASLHDGQPNRMAVQVRSATYVGERWVTECVHAGGGSIVVNLPGWGPIPAPGEQLRIGWASDQSVLLKANSE
jgi:ABC-type Fe3+/spermidine/putrescine transport system ATPase subunit